MTRVLSVCSQDDRKILIEVRSCFKMRLQKSCLECQQHLRTDSWGVPSGGTTHFCGVIGEGLPRGTVDIWKPRRTPKGIKAASSKQVRLHFVFISYRTACLPSSSKPPQFMIHLVLWGCCLVTAGNAFSPANVGSTRISHTSVFVSGSTHV